MADLIYNIEEERLRGTLGTLRIDTHAGSGGRAGSKQVSRNLFLTNNSYATHIGGRSSRGTHNYGPIPRGFYTLREHESRTNWTRLIADEDNVMFSRDGFAIHGRGNVGSHGCIVPDDFQVIKNMIRALRANPSRQYKLEVISIGPNIGWQNRIG